MDRQSNSPRQDLLWAYNALQVVGFTSNLLIVLVATVSRNVKRTVVWYLFMHGWVVWCISHFLIIEYQAERQPPFGLCLVQAAFVYAGPPCMALLTLGTLAQLYCAMYANIQQSRPPGWLNPIIIATPFAVLVIVFLEVIAVGLHDRTKVVRDQTAMYCNMTDTMVVLISGVLDGLTCIIMLVLEVLVFRMMYLNWGEFKQFSALPGSVTSGTMAIRITVFSFLPMVALGLSLQATVAKTSSPVSHIAVASLPVAAAVIFGTQQDLYSCCISRRKDNSAKASSFELSRREYSGEN